MKPFLFLLGLITVTAGMVVTVMYRQKKMLAQLLGIQKQYSIA